MTEPKDRDVIRPFEVDGIKEYDNPMPSWWVILFYACILFSVVYLIFIHGFGLYRLEDALVEDRKKYAVFNQAGGAAKTDEQLGSLVEQIKAAQNDPVMKEEGQKLFDTTCAPCHGPQGQGIVGPNLTDKFWVHGGKPEQIFATVSSGVPEKGMPAWGPVLGPKKVLQITTFILTMKNTNVSGKAPEGSEESE